MYLKSLEIKNFRKFGDKNNVVEFINSQDISENNEINIAQNTTLIIGKNNSGKTTIIEALEALVNDNFLGSDFNFFYLKKLFEGYKNENQNNQFPEIEFRLIINLEKNENDDITNLVPLMTLEDLDDTEIELKIKVVLKESQEFLGIMNKEISKPENFLKIIEQMNKIGYETRFYRNDDIEIENFKLDKLINVVSIKANNVSDKNSLKNAFNKIISYRFNEKHPKSNEMKKEEIENELDKLNKKITRIINKKQTKDINHTLSNVISQNNLKIFLNSDLSLDKALNNLINYQYLDKGIPVPENQFGLGYTNFVMIIANLIDYIDKHEGNMSNSKINLICIEEPETYMHPQMQELFIKYINDAINNLLLKEDKKNLNSQLVISTHSSHILNSKIHSGDGFDNINYVTFKNNESKIIVLSDKKLKDVISEDKEKKEQDEKLKILKFIKKHVKFKVSELFFSDAIILVEGNCEYNLLPLYIDKNKKLKQRYITFLNIGGAHAFKYRGLLKLLEIPSLIITDLDIEREDTEDVSQIEKIKKELKTSNKTLKNFNDSQMISDLIKNRIIIDKNIIVCYQNRIGKFYPTSFEEAFILTNFDNNILNDVLEKIRPGVYEEVMGKEVKNFQNNKEKSYRWQKTLNNSKKTELADTLFYEIIMEEDDNKIPKLPEYIKKGLNELDKLLKENGEIKNVIKNK
ncbi:ATP-dependent nuclease [Leptotrichia sp.]